MEPRAIIKRLDVIEDGRVGLIAGGKAPVMHGFVFQAAPERHDERVVIAVALPAHRGDELMRGEGLAKRSASNVTAAVGVHNERGLGRRCAFGFPFGPSRLLPFASTLPQGFIANRSLPLRAEK